MAQRDTPDTAPGAWTARRDHTSSAPVLPGSSANRVTRTHGITMADVERLDRVRQKVMRGRRFQINSADLLHEARRETGRE